MGISPGQYAEFPVGTADGVLAPADVTRSSALISNPGPVDVYLAFGRPAAVGQSFRVPAGGAPVLIDSGSFPGLCSGAVHAIAAGAGGRLAICYS